jgi:hypothetical protein
MEIWDRKLGDWDIWDKNEKIVLSLISKYPVPDYPIS